MLLDTTQGVQLVNNEAPVDTNSYTAVILISMYHVIIMTDKYNGYMSHLQLVFLKPHSRHFSSNILHVMHTQDHSTL